MGSITEPTTTSEPAIWPAVRRAIDEFCGTIVASSPRGVQARVRSLIDREPVAASTEIYVRLLDEGALVWRPVRAEYLGDDRFRITDERMAALEEVWEFANGDEVRCEMTQGYDGPMLTATRRSDD